MLPFEIGFKDKWKFYTPGFFFYVGSKTDILKKYFYRINMPFMKTFYDTRMIHRNYILFIKKVF